MTRNSYKKFSIKPIFSFLVSPYFVVATLVLVAGAGAAYYFNANSISASEQAKVLPPPQKAIADWTLGMKDYSGKEISSLGQSSSDCEKNKTARLVILTDYDLSKEKNEVETAVMNGSTWTRRGRLYSVNQNVLEEISKMAKQDDSLVSLLGSTGLADVQRNVKSGVLYEGVPAEQDLILSIYPLENNYRSLSGKVAKVRACKTIFIFVKKNDSTVQKKSIAVCLHSLDKSNNYKPKQTFILPDNEEEVAKYRQENPKSEIDLGNCQNDEAVKQNAQNGKELFEAVTQPVAETGESGDEKVDAPSDGNKTDSNSKEQPPAAIGAADIKPDEKTRVLPPRPI